MNQDKKPKRNNEGICKIHDTLEGNNIHAYEAAPNIFKPLVGNHELNQVRSATINNSAVSNGIGTAQIVYYPKVSGSSSFEDILRMSEATSIKVHTITLNC